MSYINGESRDQITMFPDVVDDYITQENPVRFIEAFVEGLDLRELGFERAEAKELGRPGYDPRDLLKLYIYGYLNRVRTSRRLEVEAGRNLELMWLMRKLKPDFKTIADFRKDNAKALRKIFREFMLICRKLELFGGDLVAVDGSKFRASNSKKKNFTPLKLKKLIQKVDERIEEYLKALDEGDARGDHRDSAEELKKKIERLREIREEHQETERKLNESGQTQLSMTDPDARLMHTPHGTYVSYNVQMAVDNKHKMIAAVDVTNEINDEHQLSVIAGQAKEALGTEKLDVVADMGYYNCSQVKESSEKGMTVYIEKPRTQVIKGVFGKELFKYNAEKDVYVCPAGAELRHRRTNKKEGVKLYTTNQCSSCEMKKQCTRSKGPREIKRHINEAVMDEMATRVRRDYEKIKKRGTIVEHPWGTMKRAFDQGYFLLRGKEKVSSEIAMTGLIYNMKRAFTLIGVPKLLEALG